MANRIIRLTAVTIGGVAVDGTISLEVSEAVGNRLGRSDAEAGDTSLDIIERAFSGALLVSDEDVDITLLGGATVVLIGTYLAQGAVSRTLTVGDAGKSSGIAFTGGDGTYDSQPGPTPETRLPFEGVYPTTATKTFTDTLTDVTTAGTALVSIANTP